MCKLLAASVLAASTLLHVETASAANWITSETISPLDDSKNVVLRTEALEPILDMFNRSARPTLIIRCQENTTSVYIVWNTFIDTEDSLVTYRIDKLPAEKHLWDVSTDYESVGLWDGASAIPFIRSLFNHDMLLVRITPYGDSPITAMFYIEGLEAAAAPLMEACHWQAWTATESQKKAPQQDEFAALMRSIEEMDRQHETRLSIGEIDALRRQIGRCWTLPVGIDGIQEMVVQLRIQVRPDRTVQTVTIGDQDRLGRDPQFRAVAQSASRAVERCSPLNLPPGKYAVWREMYMNFYPEDAISG